MNLDPAEFRLHDVTGFPLVWANAAPAGDPGCWGREMDRLIAQGAPFVALHAGGAKTESQDDRKERALWFKRNKAAMSQVCKAVIAVEGDASRRAAMQLQALPMRQAFGVPMEVVATRDEAEDLAWEILF
jgi:hypothetical protein